MVPNAVGIAKHILAGYRDQAIDRKSCITGIASLDTSGQLDLANYLDVATHRAT